MVDDQGIFHDDAGEPVLIECAVLFADLLGTAGPRSRDDALKHLRATKAAVRRARDALLEDGQDEDTPRRATWFSDNLNIYAPVSDFGDSARALAWIIDDVSFLQLELLREAFIARGAVTIDGFYAGDDFLYGPALDRAVLLERTRARYPRVILDEAAIAAARASHAGEWGGSRTSQWRQDLLVDRQDGAVFIDYLGALHEDHDDPRRWQATLSRHRSLIEGNLRRYDGIPAVEEKYRWLAGYHNFFVTRFRELIGEEDAARLGVECSRPLGDFELFAEDIDELEPEEIGLPISDDG